MHAGDMQGSCFISFTADDFYQPLTTLKVGSSGAAFVIDTNGVLIASSLSSLPAGVSIFSLTNTTKAGSRLLAIASSQLTSWRLITSTDPHALPYSFDYADPMTSASYVTPIAGGWSVQAARLPSAPNLLMIIVSFRADFMGNVLSDSITRTVISTVVVLVFSILLSLAFVHFFTRPLLHLASFMMELQHVSCARNGETAAAAGAKSTKYDELLTRWLRSMETTSPSCLEKEECDKPLMTARIRTCSNSRSSVAPTDTTPTTSTSAVARPGPTAAGDTAKGNINLPISSDLITIEVVGDVAIAGKALSNLNPFVTASSPPSSQLPATSTAALTGALAEVAATVPSHVPCHVPSHVPAHDVGIRNVNGVCAAGDERVSIVNERRSSRGLRCTCGIVHAPLPQRPDPNCKEEGGAWGHVACLLCALCARATQAMHRCALLRCCCCCGRRGRRLRETPQLQVSQRGSTQCVAKTATPPDDVDGRVPHVHTNGSSGVNGGKPSDMPVVNSSSKRSNRICLPSWNGGSVKEVHIMQSAFSSVLSALTAAERLSEKATETKCHFIRYIFHELRVPFNALTLGIQQLQLDHDQIEQVLPDVASTIDLMEDQGIYVGCMGTCTRML